MDRCIDSTTMRVLHVITQFPGRAGAEVSLRDLVLATQGARLDHAIAVLKPQPNDSTAADEGGVPNFVPPRRVGPLEAVPHLRAAIRDFSPDLVHTSLFDADVAGRIAARSTRVPVLTSLVNTPYAPAAQEAEPVSPVKQRLAHGVDALLARHATTAFHAITSAVADDAAPALGVARERIHVVPRGRSRAALGKWSAERRARTRQMLGLGSEPVVLNIARQEPQKGQWTLLRALPSVRAAHPDVMLLIAGREGRSTAALGRIAAEAGIEDAVRWLGVRRDVPDLLCAADAFVFPSEWEGLGGALLEAMALRVPVVASDIPALSEVLDGGRCGALVPPGDPRALADGVLEVLERGPDVATRLDAAEGRFLTTYELTAVANAMVGLYHSVVLGG